MRNIAKIFVTLRHYSVCESGRILLIPFLYRFRWLFTLMVLSLGATTSWIGGHRLEDFSAQVKSLKGGEVHPDDVSLEVFDARYDIWFSSDDPGLKMFHRIEDKFVAEDFILVAFEEKDDPLGVFSPKALETIARLTRKIERIPYVRHCRSLTSNPWIRWGNAGVDSSGEVEEGLIVSDLFKEKISSYSEKDIHERMIAVIGAEQTAKRIGEDKVRAVIGKDAKFSDYIGEPRLHNNIISKDGGTTALQLLILRPRLDDKQIKETFGEDKVAQFVGPEMFKNKAQWSALTGLEHILAAERGLFVPAKTRKGLEEWIQKMPEGKEKELLTLELKDPSSLFMRGPDGTQVRKFHFYEDNSKSRFNAGEEFGVEPVPANFKPDVKSEFKFYMAGMPTMARHMRNVGMADMKYVALMFAVIFVVLLVIFRKLLAGPFLIFSVMILSIVGMAGFVLVIGDSLNNLTAVSPTMLTAISIADAMHLVAAYFLLREKYDNREELICEVLKRNIMPVLLTTLTTAVGFFSLMVSTIVPIYMLGYTAGVGTIIAFFISITFVPAMLSLLPLPKKKEGGASEANTKPEGEAKDEKSAGESEDDEYLAGSSDKPHWGVPLTKFVIRNRIAIIASSFVVLVVALIGFTKLELDGDFRAMFRDDDPVVENFDWVDKRLGGTGDLELVFSTPKLNLADEKLAQAREERLAILAGRKIATAEGIDDVEPLSKEEDEELARLKKEQELYQQGRIGVSFKFLKRLDLFEKRLQEEIKDEKSPLYGVVTRIDSPLAVVRKIHQVQNQNKAAFYRLPDESDVAPDARKARVEYDDIIEELSYTPPQSASTLIAQYYLQYENGAKPTENLSSLISADRRDFRVQGRVLTSSSKTQLRAYAHIRKIAEKEFPDLASTDEKVSKGEALSTMTLSGRTVLLAGMMKMFEDSLVESLSLAAILITIIIGIIYRSIWLALISPIPNLLPILVPMGFLGFLGEAISGPTVLVATVALGVCVDDTIHFFTKFTYGRKKGWSPEKSMEYAFHHVGAALSFTTIVLIVGFSVLIFSAFMPNRTIGVLALWMFGLAILADFVVTPAFLSFMSRSDKSEPEKQA